MKRRDTTAPPEPMRDKATGLWFKVPGRKGTYQRYDEAACLSGTAHWYLIDGRWHAFRDSDVQERKGKG